MTAKSEIPIQAAATLVLVKDGLSGPEVLMQQRNAKAIFGASAWVFPGGKLDPEDYSQSWIQLCDTATPLESCLAHAVAAIRETVEEAGILLAHGTTSNFAQWIQQAMTSDNANFLRLCQDHQLTLRPSEFRYLGRWITPPGSPRRYDTRFFLAPWPKQPPRQDDYEAVNTCWITPAEALKRYSREEWALMYPTRMTLQRLERYPSTQDMLGQEGAPWPPAPERWQQGEGLQ